MALGSTQPLVRMSTRNISRGKGGRCVRLTSPPLRAECHEIWESEPLGTLWATPGLLRDSFTFTAKYGPPVRSLIYVTPPDAWNFEVVPRFLENFCIPDSLIFLPQVSIKIWCEARVTGSKFLVDDTHTHTHTHKYRRYSTTFSHPLVLPSLQFGLRNLEFQNRKHKNFIYVLHRWYFMKINTEYNNNNSIIILIN
jgi:hypothetical protein